MQEKGLVFCGYALETAVQVVRSPLLSFPLLVVSGCVFLSLVVDVVQQGQSTRQEEDKGQEAQDKGQVIIIGH